MKLSGIIEGATYKIPYPFTVSTYSPGYNEPPEDCWKPGCVCLNSEESHWRWAYDEWGWMVVTIHKIVDVPGFKPRCFYTLQWIDPEGREFGRYVLRVKALSAVGRMVKGHRYLGVPEGMAVEITNTEAKP